MTDTAISALTAGTTIAGTEVVPGVQSAATVKFTFNQVKTFLQTAFGLVKSNSTTVDPTTSDTTAAGGYADNSRWMNSTTGASFTCRDATNGLWFRMDVADHPGYLSGGFWYPSVSAGQLGAGTNFGTATIRLYPFIIKERVSISSLGARVTTAAASGNFPLAIYAMNATTKRPTGTAIATTADILTTSTGLVNAAIVGGNKTLEPGIYYAAINQDATAGSAAVYQILNTASTNFAGIMGSTTQSDIASANAVGSIVLSIAQAYNTWPDLTGQSFTNVLTSGFCHIHIKTV